MPFKKGDRVEINIDNSPAKAGDCGKVTKVFSNGDVMVEITHDKNCNEIIETPEKPKPVVGPLPQSDFTACHCPP